MKQLNYLEMYTVIYVWKILEEAVLNFGNENYVRPRNRRHGTVPNVPAISSRVRNRYSFSWICKERNCRVGFVFQRSR